MQSRSLLTWMLALGVCFGVADGNEPSRKIWGDPGTNILGAPSPDGRYLSYVDASTGDLALLDLVKGDKRRLTHKAPGSKPGEFAYFSIISPDNRMIAYAWFNSQKFYDLR